MLKLVLELYFKNPMDLGEDKTNHTTLNVDIKRVFMKG